MAVNAQQLEKEGVYEAKGSIASLLAELEQVSGLALMAAARRKRLAKRGGLITVAGVVVMIVGATMGSGWLLLLSLAAVLFGIGLMLYALFSTGKLLAHPTRLNVAKERLSMIQADAGEKAFALRLALASRPVCTRKEAWHARKSGNQEFFEEQWLSLEGPLMDGTVISDEVKELTRKRTYRNPRGKYKSKSRLTYLVNLRFSYPAERYGDARAAQQALQEQVKVGPGALLRKARVTEKAIVMRALVNTDQEITRTAGMLSMGAYRILNLARRMARAKGGNAQ